MSWNERASSKLHVHWRWTERNGMVLAGDTVEGGVVEIAMGIRELIVLYILDGSSLQIETNR